MIFRFFVLDTFKSGLIDNVTLESIATDFDVARRAFFKVMVRFAYTTTFADPPPRGDAPKSIILQHIAQLAPILHDNADIILTVQHGFIGTWGEGYYTDYFGDAGNVSSQQQMDRQEVYDALINSVPQCTMVQVRTWQYMERLAGSSLPVASEDAYSCGNDSDSYAKSARTGLHNDCFLASETDFGTWLDSSVDRPRMSDHSIFTVFGGETCNPMSSRNDCPTALEELGLFHFTFLNNLYHPDVLNLWRDQGCYDNITKNLGYRLVLVSSRFPDEAMTGSEINFDISVRNDGFTAPVSKMKLQLVLKELEIENNDSISHHVFEFDGSNTDPRFWFGNGTEHTLTGRVMIPTNMNNGIWNVFLAIVDASPSLSEIPQYNIMAVNQNYSSMQEMGLNSLSRSIVINSPAVTMATEPGTGMETSDSSPVHCVQLPYVFTALFCVYMTLRF